MNFDRDTAEHVFGGKGRTVRFEDPEHFGAGWLRGNHIWIDTPNGFTFSATWNLGTYCTAGRIDWEAPGPIMQQKPPPTSPNAEVAFWRDGSGGMIAINGDTVIGYITPERLLTAIEAAERNDEAAIIVALTEDDE